VKGFVNAIIDVDYSKIKAVCIGQQTADAASSYGMQIMISDEASMDSMIELIEREFGA
jgi:uroporphyrinogen III methyltransferase/synthase